MSNSYQATAAPVAGPPVTGSPASVAGPPVDGSPTVAPDTNDTIEVNPSLDNKTQGGRKRTRKNLRKNSKKHKQNKNRRSNKRGSKK
jgi:hypothetical protein